MKKVKRKNNFLSKKQLCLYFSSIITLVMLSFGLYQTHAALMDSDEKQNDFRVGNVQTEIVEEFNPPAVFEPDKDYVKKAAVKNTGEQAIFVRVLALPMLTKKQSGGSPLLLPATTDGAAPVLTIDYNLTDWLDGADGYFYYKKRLNKNEITNDLFTKVRMNAANITEEYTGANLTFELKAEGIGITPFAYRDAWWNGQRPTNVPLVTVDDVLKDQTVGE
ncbi:hypothetical protein GIX45_07130 [Erwinia sp. CPCC 100877]|nr:hypothetical protein [Erwinia sp. CPCC 100877]